MSNGETIISERLCDSIADGVIMIKQMSHRVGQKRLLVTAKIRSNET